MDERFDAGMMAVDGRRVQQPWRSIPNDLQQVVERR